MRLLIFFYQCWDLQVTLVKHQFAMYFTLKNVTYIVYDPLKPRLHRSA